MKDFLKFTLATITGIIVSSVLLFILSIGVMFSLLYASDAEVTVPQNAILKLELDGTLAERSQEDPLTLLTGSEQQTTGLDDLLTAIRKAKEHENPAQFLAEKEAEYTKLFAGNICNSFFIQSPYTAATFDFACFEFVSCNRAGAAAVATAQPTGTAFSVFRSA